MAEYEIPIKISEVKSWSSEIEAKITENWKNQEIYRIDEQSKKPIYSIDTPPPYINSPIHIGHASSYCYMDFFARYKRMKGFQVLFPLGLDRNGLPIEIGAEKKYNISAFNLTRKEFLEYCERLLSETSLESMDTFAKLGISFSSYKKDNKIGSVYFTDSPEYRTLTQSTFIELYKKGIIYEDNRINNWDTKLQTTVADSEIEYKEIKSTFNYIKWKVKETNEEIIIATTRPELICTCERIIFNPEDKRYLHLKNKNAISPIYNKEIPIIPHPIASIEKGSGLVMMCSAGDLSDIQFFRELKIKPTIAINKDGRMNSNAGFLEGLKVREAREKIINELKNRNLIQKQEEIMHKTPISERSGTEIEFIEMSEFYLKQIEIKNKIKSIARKIKFYPPESRRILYSWIDSISIDWPISRRRFYATPIPLWYCREKNLVVIPPEGRYYQPWKESPPKDAEVYRNGKKIGKVNDFNENWIGEERVFDTWFDSSISELFILGYKRNNEFFNKSYPATLRPQGKEIVRTWLYYTLLRGYLETKKPCFRDVWIHQHILDERGRKMSKSLGNVINPQEIIREIGAECFRLWIAEEGDLSKQDLSCSKEKIRSMRKSINKLINVSRFIMQFKKPEKPKKIEKIDELFIACIEDLTLYCDKCYEKYDFYHPAIKLREFLWETFASHYIELIKSRAYNEENKFSEEESNSARYSLHFILERYLHLVYPIIPQVSSVIAFEKGINLLKADFPKPIKHKVNTKKIEKIIEFNKKVWKAKKESGISLRSAIKNIKIPRGLEEYEKDIRMCHNL